jgi:hypothetical protein
MILPMDHAPIRHQITPSLLMEGAVIGMEAMQSAWDVQRTGFLTQTVSVFLSVINAALTIPMVPAAAAIKDMTSKMDHAFTQLQTLLHLQIQVAKYGTGLLTLAPHAQITGIS